MNFIEEFFGTLAFVTSFIGLLPQIYKTLKTKSAADLSLMMLINYLVCSVAWIVYGTITESAFVVSSNVIGLITTLILIMQKHYYDSRRI